MLDRRTFLITAATATVLGFASSATAAERMPFSQKAFETAQKIGRPILIEITASWCPTCKAQKAILSKLTHAPELKNLAIFEVDFDSQKDVVKAFGARMQSTLITFKGSDEVGRSVGDTNADSIKQLLDKAI